MNDIKVLDCTLRDGGYVVDTIFGDFTIKGVIQKLTNAKIDVIEIGYIKDCTRKDGSTTFSCFQEIMPLLPKEKPAFIKYAVMIEYGTFDLKKLIPADESSIEIIRLCFFKNDVPKIHEFAKSMMDMGYEIYLQPMDTLGYSDAELLDLVEESNKIQPKALYIVDSYGSMYSEDLEKIYFLINTNLDSNIYFGLHSHNNLQMSFMLVQKFIDLNKTKRNVVVDSSCAGIGRGAGNANTELVIDYLNRHFGKSYELNEILDILDTYILAIQKDHSWGYSTPYFISGMYSVHVNNINYLLKKHNLKAKDMNIIISNIDKNAEKRYDYDKLENLVINYQSKDIDDSSNIKNLQDAFKGKKILLVAPGSSINKESAKIADFISSFHPIVICVNSLIPELNPDYLFFSNILRYEYAEEKYPELFDKYKRIITSNIKLNPSDDEFTINYHQLIKQGWKNFDNSTIMCLRLLAKLHVKDISIAGLDGYDLKNTTVSNYVDNNILINLSVDDKRCLNEELAEMINDYCALNDVEIHYITNSHLKLPI